MRRAAPLLANETYHIYNRGAHKQDIFTSEWDYQRFAILLYLSNSSRSLHLSNLLANKKYQGPSLLKLFEDDLADKELVDIFAYCLMPNHFHLILQPKTDTALPQFMKKLLTAYSMYFNTKYEHSGVLFQGRFKSVHIDSNDYFRYLFTYVHLNPFDLFEPGWKERGFAEYDKARDFLNTYAHSSFADYCGPQQRPQSAILALESAPDFLKTQNDLESLFIYHQETHQQGRSLLV